MIENKKVLYAIIAAVLTIIILAIVLVLNKTRSKDLISTINKVYLAYSSYVVDLGHSPADMNDLIKNNNNIAKWNGPYISKTILDNYEKDSIQIIQASNIPTKSCSLDSLSYCYKWIKIVGLTSNEFNEIKESINKKSGLFFAKNSLFFKLSSVE